MSIQRQGEAGRLALVAAIILALVLGAFALVNELGTTSAGTPPQETTGMAMVPVSGGTLNQGGEYDVPLDTKFVLGVEMFDPPAAGYILAASFVDYGDHVTYNGTNAAQLIDEIIWDDCLLGTVAYSELTATSVAHGCLTGLGTAISPLFGSNLTGNFIELSFTCSSGDTSTTVKLVPEGTDPAGTSGALYTEFETNKQLVPNTTDLQVNCGAGGELPPTPTHTETATATATSTETPTPTITPTITPTFTPLPGALMSLNATGGNVSCSGGAKPTGCVAEFWPGQEKLGEFTILVNANVIPEPDGYGGFQTEVLFGEELTYNPRNPDDSGAGCVAEVVWPNLFDDSCVRSTTDPPRHDARSASAPDFTDSDHVGALVELDVHCNSVTDNNTFVRLTRFPDGGVSASAFFLADDTTETVGDVNPPYADELEIDCVLVPPAMSLRAFGPGVECDSEGKCTAPFDEENPSSFTIALDADAIPDGYGGFKLEMFFAGLVYEVRPCSVEVIWRPDSPTAFNCTAFPPPTGTAAQNVRRLNARATENALPPLIPDFSVGTLAEMRVSCQKESQSVVGLTKYNPSALPPAVANAAGSTFLKANEPLEGNLEFQNLTEIGNRTLDVDGDTVKDETDEFLVLDLLRINCVAPEPEPTATITPTVTNTLEVPPTATDTPCPDGICPTPTETHTPTVTDTPTETHTPTEAHTPTITPTPAPLDSAHDTVPPGGKVTTGFNAEPGDPVETSVTLPVGGKVSIIEKVVVQPDPPGFHLFGQQVNISAPAGTAQFPLIIRFLVDESIVPDGITAANLPLFKGGILVPNCTGPTGKASPDPCVAKRNTLTGPAEGDLQLTVHTSTASAWNFGEPLEPPDGEKPDLGDVNGDGGIDPLDALWVLFQSADIAEMPFPNVADVNGDGVINPLDASLILQLAAGMIDEFPGAPSGIFWSWLGF